MEPHMVILSSASKMLMKKEKNHDTHMGERERQKLLKNNFIGDFNKLKTGRKCCESRKDSAAASELPAVGGEKDVRTRSIDPRKC